jgi:hypothetical protein
MKLVARSLLTTAMVTLICLCIVTSGLTMLFAGLNGPLSDLYDKVKA